jgi:hypothetical protein
MDAEMWGSLLKATGDLTLLSFLFANWWMERKDRIAAQAKHETHLQSNIDRLLDATETKPK